MGVRVTMIFDVGVAGPHRLPEHLPKLADVDAVVVIAGMEGALPSVVGGYMPCPVIAVPTSVGYGANLGGVAALLLSISLNISCAPANDRGQHRRRIQRGLRRRSDCSIGSPAARSGVNANAQGETRF